MRIFYFLILLLIGQSLQAQQIENRDTYKLEGAGGYSTDEVESPKSKTGVKFSEAYPEEINSKNFPDVLDTFDYPNVEIKDLVQVMSELTGKRFILDDKVSGRISIMSPGPVTVAEAYKAFLSALQMNDLTVVPAGKFLKVVRTRDAIKDSIETYTGEYFPDADQFITKIVKLQHIPVAELDKSLRSLYSKDGDLKTYEPTNSLIISDYGSNVEKILRIIEELDVPGFEEKMEVIKIKYAQAKDIAELINDIINKGEDENRSPRFRRRNEESESKGAVSLSYVTPDERTNSVIVLGNERGVEKAKDLVKTLDFKLEGGQQGGVYVYYVKYNNAEDIAETLGGIAEESEKAKEESQKQSGVKNPNAARAAEDISPATPSQVFGSEVSVKADKNTNSIVITASNQDYQKVLTILEKIDIPRDQVFVQTVIMELTANNQRDIGMDIASLETQGQATPENPADNFAPQGFFGNGDSGIVGLLQSPLDFIGGLGGGILSFAAGEEKTIRFADGSTRTVGSIMGVIKLIQEYRMGNVLSTPKIMALDNEEAILEIGQDIVVGNTVTQNASTSVAGQQRQKIATKLEITPSISPSTDSVRLKLKQTINDIANREGEFPDINEKLLQTNLVVPNGDTAVLGGLVSEKVSNTTRKVPLVGDIPILGWLFRSKSRSVDKSNLMLFITPRIIRNPAHQKALLKDQMDKRLNFIKKNMKGVDPHGEKADELTEGLREGDDTSWNTETPEDMKEYPAVDSL